MMRTMIFILSMIYLLGSPAWADAPDQDMLAHFFSAANHYKEGKYPEAITDYEAILNRGVVNANVYFNLANSYYRNQDLGRSILNYERALRLSPRDGDINFNARFVRASLPIYGESSGNMVQRLLEGHARFYTREEMMLIMTFVLILLIGADIAGRLLGTLAGLSWNLKIIFTIILIVYLIGFVFKLQYERNQAVIFQSAQAMFEPRDQATVHFELNAGETVKILRHDYGWYKIKRTDGKMGWVPEKDLNAI